MSGFLLKEYIWDNLSAEEQVSVLARPVFSDQKEDLHDQVSTIINAVKRNGDQALHKYTARFDGYDGQDLKVSNNVLKSSGDFISDDLKKAIETAYRNITSFYKKQGYTPYETEITKGISRRRIVRPLESVGLYIPGGTAPLFSTVLMLGVPSGIAGCPNRILCTPPDKDGHIHPAILYAAGLCGICTIYKAGGAQAIAAMAYGTQTIPKADKIFGPGNAYVTKAKAIAASDADGAAMDMPAGPSEICVIADKTTNPAFAASDLLSQAEHDTRSHLVLIGCDDEKIEHIQLELTRQLKDLPRKDIAEKSLRNSVAIRTNAIEKAIEISNRYAPEHLILCVDQAEHHAESITHAGSVFLGQYTPESVGDYASGTNHVLPTYGYARTYSGLNVEAFQKTITIQSLTKDGLLSIGPAVEEMAAAEGLVAHKNAVTLRMQQIKDDA